MLYTRKGDGGTTNLKDGTRVEKSSLIFDVLGNIDELNSMLGYAKVLTRNSGVTVCIKTEKVRYDDIITLFQQAIFCIQAELSGSDTYIDKKHILFLEEVIYEIETVLPPMTSFIVPGGGKSGTYLDVVRTIARRAERSLVLLSNKGDKKIRKENIVYLNRLSSALYALARFANYQSGYTEQKPEYI